jgi:hypothetical protein
MRNGAFNSEKKEEEERCDHEETRNRFKNKVLGPYLFNSEKILNRGKGRRREIFMIMEREETDF